MPRVSVLVAAYNCANYVQQTVESAIRQTYDDLEVIVVDDGSTDGTGRVLERYADHPKVTLLRQDNAGPSAAFNKARRAATGELLAVLDGDDVCWPRRVERQVSYLDATPGVSALGAWARLITENGRPFGILNYPSAEADIRRKMWPGESGPRAAFCGASVMLRAASVERVGGWDEAYSAGQDLDIIVRLSEHYGIANLGEVLYDYRIHGSQISQTNAERKAIIRYAIRVAARHRRDGKPVPAWCRQPPSREELERLGEPVHEVDDIAFRNLMYTGNIWATRAGFTRAAGAAEAALRVAEHRQLGEQKRLEALALLALCQLWTGHPAKALQSLRRERNIPFEAAVGELRREMTRRLHQLKYWKLLVS